MKKLLLFSILLILSISVHSQTSYYIDINPWSTTNFNFDAKNNQSVLSWNGMGISGGVENKHLFLGLGIKGLYDQDINSIYLIPIYLEGGYLSSYFEHRAQIYIKLQLGEDIKNIRSINTEYSSLNVGGLLPFNDIISLNIGLGYEAFLISSKTYFPETFQFNLGLRFNIK